jgi:hypothetical protein
MSFDSFLPSCLERLLATSTGLLSLTEASRACITEVPSYGISSILSILGHNSPILGLESLDVAAVTEAPSELAPEEKWTKCES